MSKLDAPTDAYTYEQMNALLSESIAKLRNNETTPAVANAMCNSWGTILRGVKLKLDYERARNGTPPPIRMLES